MDEVKPEYVSREEFDKLADSPNLLWELFKHMENKIVEKGRIFLFTLFRFLKLEKDEKIKCLEVETESLFQRNFILENQAEDFGE